METVKYRSVTIPVYPIKRGESEYWQFRRANGQQVTRSTREKARAAALREAQVIFKGGVDIEDLTPDQIRGIKRMLEVDPDLAMVDEFLLWHSRRAPKKNSLEALAEFLAAKEAGRGLSPYNVGTLRLRLKGLPNKNLADIVPADFPALAGVARTRDNKISAWITFFRWCRKQGYLPFGEATAPERLDRPQIARGVPSTWSPAELRVLLAQVTPCYLPWLALAAYAGFRTEEICPDPKSGKSGLAWEDFQWDRDIIIVRPETAKTGRRRIVPILPALRAILEPLKGQGPIGPHRPPHTPRRSGVEAETTRLGKVVGGWRRNALRHSWISYRAAIVGMSQTAMEAGNSEAEARKSYDDAKAPDEAGEWFSEL
jgi:integrase